MAYQNEHSRLFAFLHIKCFSYKVYCPAQTDSDDAHEHRTPRLRSLGHVMDFRETFRELWSGTVYMWHKTRRREPVADLKARRHAAYEVAFGRTRTGFVVPEPVVKDKQGEREVDDLDLEKADMPIVHVEVEEQVDFGGSRLWLGSGRDYGYGLQREQSEDLEVQIERELERRGYDSRMSAWCLSRF